METGLFICAGAIVVEIVLFLVMLVVILFGRFCSHSASRLKWLLLGSAAAAVVAFAFSFLYSRDSTWYLVLAGVVLLPIVQAALISYVSKRQAIAAAGRPTR